MWPKPKPLMQCAAYGAALVLCGLLIDILLIASPPADSTLPQDQEALEHLHRDFHKCVEKNGIGIYSRPKGLCKANFFFSEDTGAKWIDSKTGKLEALDYDLDLCDALSVWEQVRNSSTILTKEYIDGLPNGWRNYAWRRINKGITLANCTNKDICVEKLSEVLPETPPFQPRQFRRCAVVGNSGDLLKAKFGQEIDSYDVVIRNNGAPTENFTDYVGTKRTFRLLNRGSAKALDKVAAMDDTGKEVLIIKTTIHDAMTRMIREVPIQNPVYLMLGAPLGSSAKGTGVKGLELALSICETVDIYGFTVDPGYSEWSRYFSESRGGHAPLLGRAYYQMMECLGLIRIHSPMRSERSFASAGVPGKRVLDAARKAAERLKGKVAAGRDDPWSSCILWKERSAHRTASEVFPSKAAANHARYVHGATQYPLEHSNVNGMLCVSNEG